ncbi:MAG: TIGR04066 family peptide maturation system protein [Oscillospiraceae bacterium]|nr:TIGR04066 family peptide maturation system protein [Oscillospiraceae bacterium]MCL2279713.1 TIGR04066 family peptide maturation system protein [Oscillospiraceae bacterium]
MIKDLAIFPITKNMCAVARNNILLQDFEIKYLLSPSFLGLGGKDICHVDGGDESGKYITDYSHDKLTSCHTLFVDYDENIKEMAIYKEVIEAALSANVDVMMSREITKRLGKTVSTQYDSHTLNINSEVDRLYSVRVPVVTVLSQGVRVDQFAVELSLRKHFINSGYNVSQFGSSEASALFGFQAFPSFLFDSICGYEKVLKLNKHIKKITEDEKSDVLILGVPGSTMKINDQLLSGLGLIPFIVCNAVKCDLAIYCLYYEDFKEKYFDEISNHCLYRFDIPVKHFNIANSSLVPDTSSETPKENYIDLKSTFVFDHLLNNTSYKRHKLFNILDNKSATALCSNVIDELSDNVDELR